MGNCDFAIIVSSKEHREVIVSDSQVAGTGVARFVKKAWRHMGL
jgi:hypothetical protein